MENVVLFKDATTNQHIRGGGIGGGGIGGGGFLVGQFNAPNNDITVPPHPLPVAPPLHTPHCCGRLFFWLIVVWKFIGMWPFKAMVFFFAFFLYCSILCMPKQWYHISHTPPACRTSSPYFPPLWTPIFGWLLCELMLISGHPKAMEYFI